MVTVGRNGQSNFLKAYYAPLIVISLLLVGLVKCKEIGKVRVLLHMRLCKKKINIFYVITSTKFGIFVNNFQRNTHSYIIAWIKNIKWDYVRNMT